MSCYTKPNIDQDIVTYQETETDRGKEKDRNEDDDENDNRNKTYILMDWCPAYWEKINDLKMDDMVDNCVVTRNRSRLEESDYVLIDIRTLQGPKHIPQ